MYKSGKIFRSEFKLGNQPIQVTDCYVYLGITFTRSGSFSRAQKKLYNKATRSLYSFLSEVNIYNGASVSTGLRLFDSLVSPILLNNCEIWGCFLKSVGNNYQWQICLENTHNKVCRMASGVPSQAINLAVDGKLGRLPLHLIIHTRGFEYFLRLSTLQNNQILNCALEINIHWNNEGKHSRFTTVTIRHLLHFTKLSDYAPNLPHLDYSTIPHLVRMFKKNS